MKGLLIGALLAFPVFASAQSSDWYQLDQAKDGDRTLIKVSSIKADGYMVTFWSKTEYGKPKIKKGERPVVHSMIRYRIACDREVVAVLAYSDYDADGNAVKSGNTEAPTYTPITPDTIGELFQAFACEWTKAKS